MLDQILGPLWIIDLSAIECVYVSVCMYGVCVFVYA